MQTMFRGKRGRKNFDGEVKAKRAMRHLFNQKAASAFRTWVVMSTRSKGVRKLMRRVKYGYGKSIQSEGASIANGSTVVIVIVIFMT